MLLFALPPLLRVSATSIRQNNFGWNINKAKKKKDLDELVCKIKEFANKNV